MGQQPSYEQFVVAEVRRREDTDYRFNYWTYLGWNILTATLYSNYATYKLIERRTQHAQRRLAFLSYLWHALNARAEAAGRREVVAEGLDNLSRIYQQMDAFERRSKREPVLWMVFRVIGFYLLSSLFAVGFGVGAYINHFLNKDLLFYDEWESSYMANAEWVLQRLGHPVTVPRRAKPVRDRNTALYVILTIVTLGIWSCYWRYAVMKDGNDHFDDDAAMEDALLRALGVGPPAWSTTRVTSAEPPDSGLAAGGAIASPQTAPQQTDMSPGDQPQPGPAP